MINYVKQRDRFRCGPVAVINAVKWAGGRMSYKTSIREITDQCHCVPGEGTMVIDLHKTLHKVGRRHFKSQYISKPTFSQVDDALAQGDAVVWNYKHNRGRHYALIVGRFTDGAAFHVINYDIGPTVSTWVSRDRIQEAIDAADSRNHAWILKKVKHD